MDGKEDSSDLRPSGPLIGPFILEVAEGQLYRGSQRVPLGRRAIALLQGLLESPSHAVTRNELVQRVWPGRCVEDANLNVQISALRKALGRDSIVTSYGRGYRLTLHVEMNGAERRRGTSSRRPLPYGNLSDHQEPPTSFVGRSEALAALASALPATRLLTLVGAGGIGKTRLALRLASSLAAERIVLVVDAGPLQEMQQLDDALARAFERRSTVAAPWRETLPQLLAGRGACLVLDNCEHLAAQCASLVKEVTALCPTLKVVAASRVRLFVPGETVFELAPLLLPAAVDTGASSPSEATELFIARAEAAKVTLLPRDFADVVRICRSVDGVPLAIELAAAWLPLLSVHEIAVRLQRDLRLLDAGPAPKSRHHTMEATIRWSYSMLESDERETFRGLSVFSGGCTVEAALAVCGAERDEYRALRCIARLQEFSLLVQRGRRLSMLEPVRQFAAAELAKTAEESELQRRHLRFYLALAERLRTSDRAAHLALLEPDLDNLRAAQQRSLSSDDPRTRMEWVIALYEYWGDTGRTCEGASFAVAALATADESVDVALRGAVLMVASRYAREIGDPEAALQHGEQALAIARKTNDTRRTINALDAIAWARFELGEQARAVATAIEAREMALVARLPLQILMAENTVGEMQCLVGNFAEAAPALQRALVLAREQPDSTFVPIVLINLGLLLIAQDECDGLPAVLLESAVTGQQCGVHRCLPYLCRAAAALSLHLNDYACAALFLGGAAGQMRGMGLRPNAEDRHFDEAIKRKLANVVDGELVTRETAAGMQLSREALWGELIARLQGWQDQGAPSPHKLRQPRRRP